MASSSSETVASLDPITVQVVDIILSIISFGGKEARERKKTIQEKEKKEKIYREKRRI